MHNALGVGISVGQRARRSDEFYEFSIVPTTYTMIHTLTRFTRSHANTIHTLHTHTFTHSHAALARTTKPTPPPTTTTTTTTTTRLRRRNSLLQNN